MVNGHVDGDDGTAGKNDAEQNEEQAVEERVDPDGWEAVQAERERVGGLERVLEHERDGERERPDGEDGQSQEEIRGVDFLERLGAKHGQIAVNGDEQDGVEACEDREGPVELEKRANTGDECFVRAEGRIEVLKDERARGKEPIGEDRVIDEQERAFA